MNKKTLTLCSSLLLSFAFAASLVVSTNKTVTKADANSGIDLTGYVKITTANAHEFVGQEVYMIFDDGGVTTGVALDKTGHKSSNIDELTKVVVMRKTDNTLALAEGVGPTPNFLSLDTSLVHFESSSRTFVSLDANGVLTDGTKTLAYSTEVKFHDNYAGNNYVYLYGHDIPTTNEHLYLIGSFASGYSNYDDLGFWTLGQTNYPVIVNSPYPTVFYFVKWESGTRPGDEFKLCSSTAWNPQVGRYQLYGTAGDHDAGPFHSDGENCYTQVAGKYYVYATKGTDGGYGLAIDYAPGTFTYVYTGTDASKQPSGAWDDAGDTSRPITNDVGYQVFHFDVDEEFKFKLPIKGNWSNTLTVTPDDDNYYYFKAFLWVYSSGNTHCNFAADYRVRINTVDHQFKVAIEFDNPNLSTMYVLDLFNSPLSVVQRAHLHGGVLKTRWPGLEMQHVSGRIYKIDYFTDMTKVNLNNNSGGQTADLTIQANKCFVLGGDWGGVGETVDKSWVSLEAATFIDNYMHFTDISVDDRSTTAACTANYKDAKDNYNALSSNAVRLEVISFGIVEERLAAWATANHDVLDTTTGGQLSGILVLGLFENNNGGSIIVIISIISISILLAVYVVSRKKYKHQ